jgi:hypothetical protein
MVSCCRQWEAAAETIEAQGIRTVILRIGVVMAREGGALKEIYKPLRFGLGAYFSDGQAWWSWIHRDDLCHMMIWAIETQTAAGVYNAVAPNPVRGKTLVQEAAKTMHQPAVFVPAPALALRLLFGEMSAVILNSNHITSAKIEQAGFRFQYPALPEAMTEIFRR